MEYNSVVADARKLFDERRKKGEITEAQYERFVAGADRSGTQGLGEKKRTRDGGRPESTLTADGRYRVETDDGQSNQVRKRLVPTVSPQRDLFSAPELSAEEKQREAVANYKVLVK